MAEGAEGLSDPYQRRATRVHGGKYAAPPPPGTVVAIRRCEAGSAPSPGEGSLRRRRRVLFVFEREIGSLGCGPRRWILCGPPEKKPEERVPVTRRGLFRAYPPRVQPSEESQGEGTRQEDCESREAEPVSGAEPITNRVKFDYYAAESLAALGIHSRSRRASISRNIASDVQRFGGRTALRDQSREFIRGRQILTFGQFLDMNPDG